MSIAYAMGQAGGGAPTAGQAAGGGLEMLFLMGLMFAIFYFLLIRPQQKRNKEHQRMVNELKPGDRIVTAGGLYGRVTGVADATLTIEIAEKVRVKINRVSVAAIVPPNTQAAAAKK